MIAHGHGDIKFAHYALNLYLADSNHMIGSFARFSRDLEKTPSCSSRLLFGYTGSTPLYETVSDGKDVCLHSLPEPRSEPVLAMKLPPHYACPIGQLFFLLRYFLALLSFHFGQPYSSLDFCFF